MVNPLWGNIFRRKAEEESLAGFLGTVQVFSELKGRELGFLETLVHVRRYSPQETIFEEGDPGSGIYVIRTGRVRISSHNPEGPDEDLALLGPGDFFGETTLSAPTTRSASARAVETSELVGLFRADLLETLQKHPVIASKLLMGLTRVVSERLQAAAKEIRILRSPSVARGEAAGP